MIGEGNEVRNKSQSYIVCSSSSNYDEQLAELDRELQELCEAFHRPNPFFGSRSSNLRQLAQKKQASVTRILTQMLNDKKQSLPFLATLESIPRDKTLQVAVLDRTAKGLQLAARLANKPFKQALRALATELGIPSERLMFAAPKSLAGISRKLLADDGLEVKKRAERAKQPKQAKKNPDIFDLNRATIVFSNEAELRAILSALPRYFRAEFVVLKNKFKLEQWEQATQPPCVHLNLRLKSVPVELRPLLEAGGDWVVELQLSLKEFLEVKKRCHAIYEILRLPVSGGRGGRSVSLFNYSSSAVLPRACPVCNMLQTFVSSSSLTLLEDVASGGQKFVRKAKWEGKEVAYSVLVGVHEKEDQLEHAFAAIRATFLREVGLLTRLDHPNIVQILGVVREQLGFITEWVSNDTLWGLLHSSRRQQSGLDVWDVAFQICDALVYVHDNGVVHFDLKSKNVLCVNREPPTTTPRNRDSSQHQNKGNNKQKWLVKLCDFGMSRELQSSIASVKAVGGTLYWQAPETIDTKVTSFLPSADVYSFGGVLIELFGQAVQGEPRCHPWMSERHEQDVRDKVLGQRLKPPELATIRELKVRELAEECLAFETGSRPSSMRKVRARLLAARLECEEEEWIDALAIEARTHVRQILTVLNEGRVNFASYLPKLRARDGSQHSAKELWTETLSFLARHSRESPRFEVALAMCLHFVPEAAAATIATATPSNKNTLSSLFEVSQRHSQVVVGAQYLSGWCSQRSGKHTKGGGSSVEGESRGRAGGAGLEVKNADASRTAAAHAAAAHFAQAAAEGYPAAQYELALYYRHGNRNSRGAGESGGRGVAEVDLEAAERLFEQAAEQGHIGAQLSLARCYGLGEGVSAQAQRAAHVNASAGVANCRTTHLEELAKSWLCRATQAMLRKEAYNSTKPQTPNSKNDGQPPNIVKQRSQFPPVNVNGVVDDDGDIVRECEWRCYLRAAACFEQGREVEQDLQEAQRLYKLYHHAALAALAARRQGPRDGAATTAAVAEEQFHLGECYEFGRGVDKDMKVAARLYRLSSEQGNADGRWRLGLCYEFGKGGVEKDLTEAARLYRLSAARGNPRGQSCLGLCFEYGKGGVKKDLNEAVRLYRLSADQGDAQGQCYLGGCYEHGKGGVEKDLNETARLYRLSANQGGARGQCFLGMWYKFGKGGLEEDLTEAVRLFRLSANQGDSLGQCNLGVCYEFGTEGIEKSLIEAVRLYRLSADQGEAQGQCHLGLCYETGKGGVKKDLTEAARLYRLSADQGDSWGQCCLGMCYEFGKGGVEKDLTEAVWLYRLSADQGNARARERLLSVCGDQF